MHLVTSPPPLNSTKDPKVDPCSSSSPANQGCECSPVHSGTRRQDLYPPKIPATGPPTWALQQAQEAATWTCPNPIQLQSQRQYHHPRDLTGEDLHLPKPVFKNRKRCFSFKCTGTITRLHEIQRIRQKKKNHTQKTHDTAKEKSLACPFLFYPMDCSWPGLSPWDFPKEYWSGAKPFKGS